VDFVCARHMDRSDPSGRRCPLGDTRREEVEGRVPECPIRGRTVERGLAGPERQF
jgi:hypothetical protein